MLPLKSLILNFNAINEHHPRYYNMKWILYIFIVSVSLGLIRRDRLPRVYYLAWIVLSVILLFAFIWL